MTPPPWGFASDGPGLQNQKEMAGVNPELLEERAKATFDVEQLAEYIYEGKEALAKRRNIQSE